MNEIIKLTEAMKIEVGRMLREGVSDEGIKAVIQWHPYPEMIFSDASYAPFIEYGKPPFPFEEGTPGIIDNNVVEGSIVKDANESEFTCAMCRNTYVKGQTDEEAMEETNSHWPGTSIEECGVVCDDCWQWMKPDQQDAVHMAYDFIAGMNKLQSMAGHTQDEFEIITKKLLDMGRVTSDDIGELRDRQ